ncbi:hypothetical protein QOZ80_5AG0370470 [Eleusine coracana subsp. coracana]|nr:hypothetical protein QOZ80_5AG0370470 [Eleusine coracana subsp. coracana]
MTPVEEQLSSLHHSSPRLQKNAPLFAATTTTPWGDQSHRKSRRIASPVSPRGRTNGSAGSSDEAPVKGCTRIADRSWTTWWIEFSFSAGAGSRWRDGFDDLVLYYTCLGRSKVNHVLSLTLLQPCYPRVFSAISSISHETMSWSELPTDLASSIADRLPDLADLTRFRSVCPSWRSASAAHAARRRVPLLLIPTQRYGTRVSRDVWSPADDSLREIPLAAARGRSFLFASHRGWTLAVAGGDLSSKILMVNPFTGASAELPPLPFSRSGKCHVSDDPVPRDLVWDLSPHGVVVGSPSGGGAFFCRHGDASSSWTRLGCDDDSSADVISSVTYCDGAFYLFEGNVCRITVVDAETLAVAAVIEPPAIKFPRWRFEANLAVSPGELLLLVRTQLLHPGWYNSDDIFMAFRADQRRVGGGGTDVVWSEVAGGIGDRTVFVDHFRAFCVEANGLNGLRSNCMYVASSYGSVDDDYGMEVTGGHYTVSVLNLDDLTTENLRCKVDKKNVKYGNLSKLNCNTFWQWPSWLLPNPH